MNEVKLKGIAESISREYDDAMKEFTYIVVIREPILKEKQNISFVSREQNKTLENFKIGSMIYVKGKLDGYGLSKNSFGIKWTWVGYTKNLKMNLSKPAVSKEILKKTQEIKKTLKTLGFKDKQISYGVKNIKRDLPIEESIEKAISSISNWKPKKSKSLKQ